MAWQDRLRVAIREGRARRIFWHRALNWFKPFPPFFETSGFGPGGRYYRL